MGVVCERRLVPGVFASDPIKPSWAAPWSSEIAANLLLQRAEQRITRRDVSQGPGLEAIGRLCRHCPVAPFAGPQDRALQSEKLSGGVCPAPRMSIPPDQPD